MKSKKEPARGKRRARAAQEQSEVAVAAAQTGEADAALTDNTEAAPTPAEEINASAPVADENTIERIDALITRVERAEQGLAVADESTDTDRNEDESTDTDRNEDECISSTEEAKEPPADAKPEGDGAAAEDTEPCARADACADACNAEAAASEASEDAADSDTDGEESGANDADERIDIPIFDLEALRAEPISETDFTAETVDATADDGDGQTEGEVGGAPTLSELIDREAEVIPFLSLSDGEAEGGTSEDTEEDGVPDTEDSADTEDLRDGAEVKSTCPREPLTAREQETKGARAESGKRRIDSIFDAVELCVFTLAAVLIVIAFFFRHAIVNGPSMDHTLAHGDNLIISDFMYEPQVGDIVVVEDYSINGPNYPIVKRIVALGGQLVRIEADGVYVDDVREEYSSETATPEDFNYIENICIMTDKYPGTGLDILKAYDDFEFVEGAFIEFRVPEGEIFLMGDNRDNSTDSRSFGSVGEESIIGKLLLRIYPFDRFGVVK